MKENVILFGASRLGEIAYQYLVDTYNIIFFCDNDKNKWGKKLMGVEIISPNRLRKLENTKIIITSRYHKEILEQLFNVEVFDASIIKQNNNTEYNEIEKTYEELYGIEAVKQRKFYNIGAGKFRHKAWTNIDFYSTWYNENEVDIQFNLLDNGTLPIESNTACIVYSSHTIEHIPNDSAANIFRETYRILKDGGIFRVTTPNIDLYYDAYTQNDRSFFYWFDYLIIGEDIKTAIPCSTTREVSIGQIFLEGFATQTSSLFLGEDTEKISDDELNNIFQTYSYENALNYCTSQCSVDIQRKYAGNHINWWNANKLVRMLKEAGFSKVVVSGYGQSVSPILRNTNFFDNTHPKISLYVEAIK